MEFLRQRAGRPLLSRRLRHVHAVQRLRRNAGQLQLVWTEPVATVHGHSQSRLVPDPGRRRIRGHPRPARRPLDIQRDAGRQHRAPEQDHRRVEEHSPGAGRQQRVARARQGRDVPLALGHTADVLAARSRHTARRGQQGVRLSSVPISRATPTATPSSPWV
jgi:hypothetical protein